jgi:hypothetical protein
MKRLWLVMLSLGLVLAFSAQAFAVDVKFSGDFYVAGMYLDKTDLRKDTTAHTGDGPSTAFFYQRLRLRTDFVVSPGLTLVTRADIMERVWGGKRAAVAATPAAEVDSAQTAYENENIAFDWAYINYLSPIGTFDVGIMNDGSTGTIFGNSYAPAGRIKYSYTTGPATIALAYTKVKDQSLSTRTTTNGNVANGLYHTDVDNDKYGIEGVYTWKTGKAGMQVNYYQYAEKRPTDNYIKNYFLFTPYIIPKLGPVALQAELNYATGKSKRYDSDVMNTGDPAAEHVSMDNISGWVDATADFNQFYFGGTVAYVSGNDPATAKEEGGTLNGGRDWNPCLIMFNYYDRAYWMGTLSGYDGSSAAGTLTNAWFYQGRVGVRPMDKLDIVASVSFAAADQRPYVDTGIHNHHGNHIMAAYNDRDYGWEADVTATYKITNNLSYMLGAGYLWTGDYYKGTTVTDNKLNDNFMLINKLTLVF